MQPGQVDVRITDDDSPGVLIIESNNDTKVTEPTDTVLLGEGVITSDPGPTNASNTIVSVAAGDNEQQVFLSIPSLAEGETITDIVYEITITGTGFDETVSTTIDGATIEATGLDTAYADLAAKIDDLTGDYFANVATDSLIIDNANDGTNFTVTVTRTLNTNQRTLVVDDITGTAVHSEVRHLIRPISSKH